MSGSLIFVSGLSGAGKTTLIRYAVDQSPDLVYLKTLTTRPQRPGEDTFEYVFVTDDEYDWARADSTEWDHYEFHGHKYGADAAYFKQLLSQGTHVICSVAPDWPEIQKMSECYGADPILIWIDTPHIVAKRRVAEDIARTSRREDATVREHFAYIFTPTDNLELDCSIFLGLIQQGVNDKAEQ